MPSGSAAAARLSAGARSDPQRAAGRPRGAVVSINTGVLVYGILAVFMTDLQEPFEGGLGGMWRTMFLLSLIFAAIVYNEKIMAVFNSLKDKFPSK